jgi:hypothetical protein
MQTVVVSEVKLTASPELAVAPRANGATPTVKLLRAGNEIVCEAWLAVKLCVTGAAAE